MQNGQYIGKDIDGNALHIGDNVGWKEDYECSGIIVGKRGRCFLVKEWDDNTGDWKEEAKEIEKDRCWSESYN